MLKIVIPGGENYNERTNQFEYYDGATLVLEHSLVSVSKWEAKWKKPFLSKDKKTKKELIDYVRCMNKTQNVNDKIFNYLSADNFKEIDDYINDKMTATTIKQKAGNRNGELITSELIYYWMFSLNIPMECQKWHLNRLMTLIEVCGAKNENPKKMSSKAIRSQNHSLNAARRKARGSRG